MLILFQRFWKTQDFFSRARFACLAFLFFFWLINIFLTNFLIFPFFLSFCHFPSPPSPSPTPSPPPNFHRLAVIADPQLSDQYSQGYLEDAPAWLVRCFEALCDRYMARAFSGIIRHFKPDGVLILGDVFDHARSATTDEEYDVLFDRFQRVFSPATLLPPVPILSLSSADLPDPSLKGPDLSLQQQPIPLFSDALTTLDPGQADPLLLQEASLPSSSFSPASPWLLVAAGNHDVGFRERHDWMRLWTSHFRRRFGPTNRLLRLPDGASILVVSSTHLDASAAPPELVLESRRFVTENPHLSRPLLVSHVPLFRSGPCLNADDDISDRRSTGYANLLDPETSGFLLQHADPVAVLSGDHHAYCHVMHRRAREVPEHTVGTFSWMQGEWWPRFALVSFGKGDEDYSSRFALEDCVMPPQLMLLIWDAVAAAVSVVGLAGFHGYRAWRLEMRWQQGVACFGWDFFRLAIVLIPIFCIVLFI